MKHLQLCQVTVIAANIESPASRHVVVHLGLILPVFELQIDPTNYLKRCEGVPKHLERHNKPKGLISWSKTCCTWHMPVIQIMRLTSIAACFAMAGFHAASCCFLSWPREPDRSPPSHQVVGSVIKPSKYLQTLLYHKYMFSMGMNCVLMVAPSKLTFPFCCFRFLS